MKKLTTMDMLTPAEALSVQISEALNFDRLVEICGQIRNAKSGAKPKITKEKANLFYEAVKERAEELEDMRRSKPWL